MFCLVATLVCQLLTGCNTSNNAINYPEKENWAYFEKELTDKKADVFFICQTVYFGDENNYNMPIDDEETKASFLGAINMEKGIYDIQTRFFAPYYRQIGLNEYKLETEKQNPYPEIAYKDIRVDFEYYLKCVNNGRPIVLAGFSQGDGYVYSTA